MPVVARDLGGLRLYGLAFSLFLTTSLLGMVLAGSWCDRSGPRGPVLLGLALFAGGLVLCGAA
jgi:MFS family permease